MKIEAKDIAVFDAYFMMMQRDLRDDIDSYRAILLSTIKNSESKALIPDREFMLGMAEDGFLNCLKLWISVTERKKQADKDIVNQIDDILNGQEW
jgi:hypothetical protein